MQAKGAALQAMCTAFILHVFEITSHHVMCCSQRAFKDQARKVLEELQQRLQLQEVSTVTCWYHSPHGSLRPLLDADPTCLPGVIL